MTRPGKPTQRIVGYLRDSDELCSRTSIEDQKPVASGYAVMHLGGEIMKFYIDEDISGQTLGGRHAYARLIADAEKGMFDVVVAEAIDRLGRRVADVTDLRDTLAYHGVELHVANIGLVTPMHAAMMGMVAEQFSRDLGAKTKRGQRGAATRGKVVNSTAYGYTKCDSSPSGRAIVPEEAAVILRIHEEFAQGVHPALIADRLKQDGIPGPRGRFWRDDTIRGDAIRRTGIIRNDLYNGELVYGRANYKKNPKTGKKRWKAGDEPLTVCPVPELRIVPPDLWERVQKRLAEIRKRFAGERPVGAVLNRQHRKAYLLSGLIKCGLCGGTYSVMSQSHYGCNLRHSAGRSACNGGYIRIKAVEERVVSAVRRGLGSQEVVSAFVQQARDTFTANYAQASANMELLESQLIRVEAKIRNLLDHAESGIGDAHSLRERLTERERDRAGPPPRRFLRHRRRPIGPGWRCLDG